MSSLHAPAYCQNTASYLDHSTRTKHGPREPGEIPSPCGNGKVTCKCLDSLASLVEYRYSRMGSSPPDKSFSQLAQRCLESVVLQGLDRRQQASSLRGCKINTHALVRCQSPLTIATRPSQCVYRRFERLNYRDTLCCTSTIPISNGF